MRREFAVGKKPGTVAGVFVIYQSEVFEVVSRNGSAPNQRKRSLSAYHLKVGTTYKLSNAVNYSLGAD